MVIQNSNEGFTFLETLVSITIITFIVILLGFCFSTSSRILRKTNTQTISDLELLKIDTKFRQLIQSINIPDWETKYSITNTQTTITLNWVNGTNSISSLEINPNILILKTDLIKYKNDKPAGLCITYLYRDKEYICSELFSSIPYGQVEI